MSIAEELYLEALADYVLQDHSQNKMPDPGLTERFSSVSVTDIVELHRVSTRRIAEGKPEDQALRIYDASLRFLTDFLAHCNKSVYAAPSSLVLLKNKYENVLQHMDSGIALFNESGRLTFINMNMARLIGLPRKALIGFRLIDVMRNRMVPRKIRKSMLHLYREMVDYRTPYHEITTGQGRHLLVTVTYENELDGDVLISVKDVTEYKRIEQAAYQNDKLAILGKISAAIAHEIRNPLTSIRGFVQFLKPELTRMGKHEYADIILDEIDRANSIIHEFLNSSKPTAPLKKPVLVHAFIKDVMLLFESDALLHQCRIEVGPIDQTLTVAVDLKQVKQVLMNIVKNAVEAVAQSRGPEGRIQILAVHEAPWIKITVSDNGDGMDADTASRLFDPFFTTKEAGTGLGLSVSYRIIKNHGGKIDVRSRPAQGTTFSICLPE
ncbi:ATP-binding protein [Gorillibacterium sp. sgz5001074]|uniref:ATP-binding protein n=1 Tax=Gorillibacterium sp. sgz5001074 TaxID=3446695 RepID=UPI003F66FB55